MKALLPLLAAAGLLTGCDRYSMASVEGVKTFLERSAPATVPADKVVDQALDLYPRSDGETRAGFIAGLYRITEQRGDLKQAFEKSGDPIGKKLWDDIQKMGKGLSEDGF